MQIIGNKALGHSKWPDLELSGGKIELTIKSIFQPLADRDVLLSNLIEKGVNESHECLEELLTE